MRTQLYFHSFQILVLVMAASRSETMQDDWPMLAPGMDGAYPDCPCLQIRSNTSLDKLFPDIVYTNDGVTYTVRYNGKTWTFSEYGTNRCSDWDADGIFLDECQYKGDSRRERPAWCDAKWCFVNRTKCSRPWRASDIFPGWSYSYQTCGHLDFYASPSSRTWNYTKPLYAFAFGHVLDHSSAQTEEPESMTLRMYLAFASVVLDETGIGIGGVRYRRALSDATRRANPSTYTGCVHDIALGNLDMCLGDIWDTEERQSMGAASFISVGSEKMYLLGPIETDQSKSLWALIGKPFSPFAFDLWALIFVVVVFVGLAMLVFEYDRHGSEFGDDHKVVKNVLKCVYLSTLSLLNASISYTSVTASGRAISLGYGLFILIAVASFTAETAAILLQNSMTVKVHNLDAALQESKLICYSAGMQARLESKDSRLKHLGVPIDSTSFQEFADRMNDGTCEYSIVGELWPDLAWTAGEHCKFDFIGSGILDFPTGFWVRDDLRRPFDWAVSRLRAQGAWVKVMNDHTTASRCEDHSNRRLQSLVQGDAKAVTKSSKGRRLRAAGSAGAAIVSDEAEPLTAGHMLGTVLILCFFTIFAIFLRVTEFMCFGLSEHDRKLVHATADHAAELERNVLRLLEHSAMTVATFARHAASDKAQAHHIPDTTLKLVEHAQTIVSSFSSLPSRLPGNDSEPGSSTSI